MAQGLSKKTFFNVAAALIFFLFSVVMQIISERDFRFGNTYLLSKEFSEIGHYQDFWILMMGHRRISSDIAFIQMLQYYGGIPEKEIPDKYRGGSVPEVFYALSEHTDLVHYALRTTRLDRNFDYAVTFSAASLAWVQKRVDEGIAVLEDALKFRPDFYQASLYLAAITIRKEKGEEASIKYMEQAIKFPDCPDMVENILAYIYEEREDYRNAIRIWSMNLDSQEGNYSRIARERINKYISFYPDQSGKP